VSWTGLRAEESSLTAPQKSAEGIVPPAMGGRPERWTRVVACGGAARWPPARGRVRRGLWDELVAGTSGDDAPVGVLDHPDSIHRTAGDVTRMSGGVGGEGPRGSSLSRLSRFPDFADIFVPKSWIGFYERTHEANTFKVVQNLQGDAA
jgi:hypothetical protein